MPEHAGDRSDEERAEAGDADATQHELRDERGAGKPAAAPQATAKRRSAELRASSTSV